MPYQMIILAVAALIPLIVGLALVGDAVRRQFHRKQRSDHVLHA